MELTGYPLSFEGKGTAGESHSPSPYVVFCHGKAQSRFLGRR